MKKMTMAEGSDDPEGEESSEWFLPPTQPYPRPPLLNTPELRFPQRHPKLSHSRRACFSMPSYYSCNGRQKKMSDMLAAIERGKKVLIGNYARQPILMSRGEGSLVFDSAGKKYIDLF